MKNSRCYALSTLFMAIILVSTIAVFHARSAGAAWQGYTQPAYPDYAPSGMPDFDEKQLGFGAGSGSGVYTWCGPVAVANSLWWLDSEYESRMFANPVPPPTYSDHFPLVTNYTSGLDDHDPNNVFPLVTNLAILMDTDGLQSKDGHMGTRWENLENGTRYYIKQQGLDQYFEVHDQSFPDFNWVSSQVLVSQGVELFLELKQWTGSGWANLTSIPSFEAGHFVTLAGVNVTTGQVLISDPYQNAYELGTAPGRSPVAHVDANTAVHNNASLVSQDAYNMTPYINSPLPPGTQIPGYPGVVWELQGYLQTIPGYGGPNYHAFIRVAIATSPKVVPEWPGYIKPAYPDYAPSGMPDFDEKQNQFTTQPGQYTWCVPVAVANSLWWLDSKYESIMFANPVPPPTISDHFPVVTNYSSWDDHDPKNVFGLVANLAFLMNTDAIHGGVPHMGTLWTDIQSGIQQYLKQQGVAGMFEVHNSTFPTFAWIDNETEVCQDVELCLEFWQWTGASWIKPTFPTDSPLQYGHCVTSAGVNLTASQVLVSDPYQDAYEAGTAPGRSPVAHAIPHGSAVHNDAQYVSQDAYAVLNYSFPLHGQTPPPGYPSTVSALQLYPVAGVPYYTFISGAVATSPTGIHDVAVINVTSAKTVIGQGYCGNLTVTAQNLGNFPENFNVVVRANTTAIKTLSYSLAIGTNASQVVMWNTTGFAYGVYNITAYSALPGDANATNDNFTDGMVKVSIPGDVVTPYFKVDMGDISAVLDAFGSRLGPDGNYWHHPPGILDPFNPDRDIDNNGQVDMGDVIVALDNFGKHYP
jgi:hypothetical protein